jgi:hypothetical protein
MNHAFASVVLISALAAASAAAAQSLGEVAKQEEARRKTITTPGKLYTNASVRPDPTPAQPSPAPGATAPAPAVADPARTSEAQAAAASGAAPAAPNPAASAQPVDETGKKDEAYWRKRIQGAREAAQRDEVLAGALQSRINALTTDFVNRDDPAQRAVIAADRQKALAELDRIRQEIARHTKAIAEIQEEARRASVPPGWLR